MNRIAPYQRSGLLERLVMSFEKLRVAGREREIGVGRRLMVTARRLQSRQALPGYSETPTRQTTNTHFVATYTGTPTPTPRSGP